MDKYTEAIKANADSVIAVVAQIAPALDRLCSSLEAGMYSSHIERERLIIYIDTLDHSSQFSKSRGVSALRSEFPGWSIQTPENDDHKWASAISYIDGVKVDITIFCWG